MHSFFKPSLFILALGLGTLVYAQTPQTATPPPSTMPAHQPNPAHEAKRLAKELNLSPDQQSQIGPILADRQQRMSALEANTTLDTKSFHKQRKAIMLDSEQKISSVLTPAQQQQLATLKAEHRHGKGAAASATAPPPAV